jgi:hypothetical protein
MSSQVEALLFEREGYVRRGLTSRVAQVDAEIRRLGGVIVDDTPVVETADRPTRKASKGH